MKKSALFHFACNDPDNGVFDGRVALAQYGDIELEAPNWEGFAFTVGDDWIRIHRRKFRFIASKDWYGNWCWNVYRLPRPEAKRLIATLRENGWRCTQGPCRLYDWWNGEGHFTPYPPKQLYVRTGQ